jgi:hypothetical protein
VLLEQPLAGGLTSMFVMYNGEVTKIKPIQCEHASSHRPNHTRASPK